MVCGLPCSGKTTWVKKYIEEHPDKFYNVLGVESVLNKMKVKLIFYAYFIWDRLLFVFNFIVSYKSTQ